MTDVWSVIGSTLLWALLSTLVILIPGTLVAYCLARCQFVGKSICSSLVGLPLVLPPTAVGYLLLALLAKNGPLGGALFGTELDVLLSWKAVGIACSVMSFPLFVRTARVGFESVDSQLEGVARTLGQNRFDVFRKITLPLARRGILAAVILSFARAIGEFGATIIIAGNIPGATQTLSTALFSAQQSGNQTEATTLLVVAIIVGFATVYVAERLTESVAGKGVSND